MGLYTTNLTNQARTSTNFLSREFESNSITQVVFSKLRKIKQYPLPCTFILIEKYFILTIKIVGTLNIGVRLLLLLFRFFWDSLQGITKDSVLHPNQNTKSKMSEYPEMLPKGQEAGQSLKKIVMLSPIYIHIK